MGSRGVLTVLLTLVIVATWGTEANPLTLSRNHLQRLHRGEIVVLDLLPPGGTMTPGQGGTALALVNAAPERVWRVLVDYASHRGLYPRVTEAEVLERDAVHALVRYTVEVGPFSFGFHVNNYPDPDRGRLEWSLAQERSNSLFRDSWGYWQLQPDRDGVLLTYAMAARTVLPTFLTRGAERDGLVETVKAVRERAERH